MSDMMEALHTIRKLKFDARQAPDSLYKQGYLDALREVEEIMADIMWKEGEDDIDEEED